MVAGGFKIDTRGSSDEELENIRAVHSVYFAFVAGYPKSELRDVMAFQELVAESAFQD